MKYDLTGKRVWVAGHRGMVGGALVRRLNQEDCEVITIGRENLNLLDQIAVKSWINDTRPDAIIIASAKVGGILANDTCPADFLYQNLMIATNIIHSAHLADVNRLMALGSSCIYPKLAFQPIKENALLTGAIEPTNEGYAIAKIAAIKLAQTYRKQYGRDYISAMPTNIYGPGDNFDLETSHVLPALIRKIHEAKIADNESIMMWGTGTPRREFLHCDDLADALIHILMQYSEAEHINVGTGVDMSILELTQLVCKAIGFNGKIEHDLSKPDGTMRKLLNVDKLKDAGWNPKISLENGISSAYQNWLATL